MLPRVISLLPWATISNTQIFFYTKGATLPAGVAFFCIFAFMKKEEIIKNILSIPGIEQLNDMQLAMLNCDARDITLTAPTGSGKTLAFAAAMMRHMSAPDNTVKALIIAPSRELVMQILSVLRSGVAKGYKTTALYGGHSMADEKNSLSPLPDIIVATPGRFLDHLQRGHLTVSAPEVLVLDEYDKTLQLGFADEMRRIFHRIGHPFHILLTSATTMPLPSEVFKGRHPVAIDFSQIPDESAEKLDIVRIESYTRDKLDTLTSLLKGLPPSQRSIVFVNHRESAERIYNHLKKQHMAVGLYHGALDQQQRATAIDLIHNQSIKVLVATDLAARGLDIEGLDNVIHYHMPVDEQAWTHRNGRTARMNHSGTVWVVTSEADTLAPYIRWEREVQPSDTENNLSPSMATIYINAGKKEKVSRGDVAGFISASSVTAPNEVGKIAVHDHYSLVAVPIEKITDTIKALATKKLKGNRVRLSQVIP